MTQQQPQQYDPSRSIRLDQFSASTSFLGNPVWIFDYHERRTRWANPAALELWSAPTLEELLKRDFTQMSDATLKRNEEILWTCQQGHHVIDQWTFYPRGQPKTVRVTIGGITLLDDEEPHICFLVEGCPLKETKVDHEVLRGVEMLRHLPIAVCQFDLQGNCMFQNPEACLLEEATASNSSSTDSAEEKQSISAPQNKKRELQEEDDASSTSATTDPSESHDTTKEEATAQSSSSTTTSPSTTTSTSSQKRQKSDGSLLHRFVDPQTGPRILQQLQTQTNSTSTNTNSSVLELEAMIHTQKGPTWAAIQIRPAKDPVTGQTVLLYSARDKTDAVEARKERQAREQKAEFFAIIAHEVRTPLHQVIGFVDLLDQTVLDQEQKSFVSVLKTATQGLMTVINDVLDFSKLEAGKLQLECIPYEPLIVVKGSLEAVRASCEERGLYLKLDYDPRIPFRLQNDPNRLRQILLNLLSNSCKFTKQGGVTVKAEYLGASQQVRFSVEDTGVGIEPDHLEIIFQKYQQGPTSIARNYGGTGLGLSICHLLTAMMGGKLGVESTVGKGTRFWFVLPATEPTASSSSSTPEEEKCCPHHPNHDCRNNKNNHHNHNPQQAQSNNPEKCCTGLRVLVAEDNKVNQKLVVKMLARMGHSAVVAENGKEAIDRIASANNTEAVFDLCLMDIQMPQMDGLEATRRLRSMGYTDLPIYGLTASVGRSDYVELGFDEWLPKPIRMKDLKLKLYRLQQQLQQQQQEEELQAHSENRHGNGPKQ